MKKLETLCRDNLNIGEDINFLEIIKFLKKYDEYSYDVFFLINFNKNQKLIHEEKIKEKDKDKYFILGFTPKPALDINPEKHILYCKFYTKNKWEYIKIETCKETSEIINRQDKKTITVLVYGFK